MRGIFQNGEQFRIFQTLILHALCMPYAHVISYHCCKQGHMICRPSSLVCFFWHLSVLPCLLSVFYLLGIRSSSMTSTWITQLGGLFHHTLPTYTPVQMCNQECFIQDCCVSAGSLLLLLLGSRLVCQPSAWPGCDNCSQSHRSLGIWPCSHVGMPSQSRGRLHAVLQPLLLPQQGNKASIPTYRH